MPHAISAAFARKLKCPTSGPLSFLLNNLNRPLNRFAVEKCQLKPGQRVLDVGCGSGIGLWYAVKRVAPHTVSYLRFNPPARILGPQWLARLGFGSLKVSTDLDKDGVVHGLDISVPMVMKAKSNLHPYIKADRVVLHYANVQNLPLQNSSIDACFHVDSFYFWPSLTSALEEICRVLRPEGVVVTVFSPQRIRRYTRWGWLRYGRADPLAYAMALESTGFCDIEWIKDDPRAPSGVHCIRARKAPLKLLS
uniref:Methyltransf_11 domain-containing protein n=1 Tax=Mesocestoides corti TaxID=53468 RepID=A0A5K3EGJ7_MESCO